MAVKVKISKSIDPEEVMTLFEQVSKRIKENPRWAVCIIAMIFILVVLYWGYGKYTSSRDEQAAYSYYVIVKSLPNSEKDWENWEKATIDFLNNYDSHPLSVLTRLDLIREDVKRGNRERVIKEAETGLQKLSASHPLRIFFLRYLAIAYTEQNHFDKALSYWNELAQIAPEEWKREIYWKRGLILEAEGKMDEARASWQEALKAKGIFPTDDLIRERINSRAKAVSSMPSGS